MKQRVYAFVSCGWIILCCSTKDEVFMISFSCVHFFISNNSGDLSLPGVQLKCSFESVAGCLSPQNL